MLGLLIMLAAVSPPISVTGVRNSYPDISPDGQTLMFQSNRSGRQAIWLADAKASNVHLLFDGGMIGTDPATPRWSPDGKQIAFAMRPAGSPDQDESEIYIMKADGSDLRRLTNSWGDDSHPHWSADGKRIFFNSPRATPDRKAEWSRQWIDIYSMAVDGSDVRRITDCKAVCTYPVPSPDGLSVAHRRVTATAAVNWDQSPAARNSEVFVTRIDDGSSRNLSNSPAFDGWPMWAPDGLSIVFASNRGGGVNVGQIYRVRPDGTGLERLTQTPFSKAQPSFSADGKSLYLYENIEESGFEIGHISKIEIVPPKMR